MNANHQDCGIYQPLLVDYSDGELSDAEALEVRNHVEACPHCREELRRLNTSLNALQSYWQNLETLVDTPERKPLGDPAHFPRRRLSIATVAASLLLLVTIATMSQFSKPWFRSVDSEQSANARSATSNTSVNSGQPSFDPSDRADPAGDAIIAMIVRDSQRARLQATIEILESQPELQDRAENLRQQLADIHRW